MKYPFTIFSAYGFKKNSENPSKNELDNNSKNYPSVVTFNDGDVLACSNESFQINSPEDFENYIQTLRNYFEDRSNETN